MTTYRLLALAELVAPIAMTTAAVLLVRFAA